MVGFSCCEIGVEILRFGFRTGGKLIRSSGAAVSSSQCGGRAVVDLGFISVETTGSLNIIVLTGSPIFSSVKTMFEGVDGLRWKLGLSDHVEKVVQIVGLLVDNLSEFVSAWEVVDFVL